MCDDGSSDDTLRVARDSGATAFRHDENKGKGASMKALLERALESEFDVLVFLDGDGQHNPDEIPVLAAPIEKDEADAVVGSRYLPGSSTDAPEYRKFGLNVLNRLNTEAGGSVGDAQSGYRSYNRKAAKVLVRSTATGYDVEMDQLFLLQKAGCRIVEVPISVTYNGLHSTSKKNPLIHGVELMVFLFNLIIREKPLVYVGVPGLIFMLGGAFTVIHFMNVFNSTGYFSVPWAIAALGLILFGLLLVMNSFIFYLIKTRPKED